MLIGEKSDFVSRLGADGTDAAFRSIVPYIEVVHIAGAGHMMHIEKPANIAPLIEHFLDAN
jgi:pimeloyl-ACP methyl ester carboxylesterase